MKFDDYGLIVSEQSGSPANMGDSAAETARWVHLKQQLNETTYADLNLFRTEDGYVRHPSPELPVDWRASDFSCDQALPLYLALRNTRYGLGADEMRHRIVDAGYRTGNGDLVSPVFFAILKESKWLLNFTLATQALLFKLPFRWSDSKKAFESTEDATGDYLNWFHAALYASPWVLKLVGKETLLNKIRSYYRNEPNNQSLLELYERVIEQKFS